MRDSFDTIGNKDPLNFYLAVMVNTTQQIGYSTLEGHSIHKENFGESLLLFGKELNYLDRVLFKRHDFE
jgi:hypothetical protein